MGIWFTQSIFFPIIVNLLQEIQMNISIYGAGYVGLVTAACFAKLGHKVLCVDINPERIAALNAGHCPIFEDQLPDLIKEQLSNGRLKFSANLSEAIEFSDIHFIAVGTPSLENGDADLSQVFNVVEAIVKEQKNDGFIITKSTVPVGTGDQLEAFIKDKQSQLRHTPKIEVVSNPEFLREGTAVYDFMNADRVVLGGSSNSLKILREVYQPLADKGVPLVSMNRSSSELCKYTANTLLACKISFMNQISHIAEKTGADIDEVRSGVGLDHRIGPHFLNAGIGYGGSCFPKDSRALIQTAKKLHVEYDLIQAIDQVNTRQKLWAIEQLKRYFNGDINGRIIGVWGAAFKPGTDDLREASSLVIIDALIELGASIRLYDPVALEKVKNLYPNESNISYFTQQDRVFSEHLDALIIATEWASITQYPLEHLAENIGKAPIFDGRNCYELKDVATAGISHYYSVGRPYI